MSSTKRTINENENNILNKEFGSNFLGYSDREIPEESGKHNSRHVVRVTIKMRT